MPTGPKGTEKKDTDSGRYEKSVQSMYEGEEKKPEKLSEEKEDEETEKED